MGSDVKPWKIPAVRAICWPSEGDMTAAIARFDFCTKISESNKFIWKMKRVEEAPL